MYERIILFGFMSDNLQKNTALQSLLTFQGKINLSIEPTRDPQRVVSTGQLFLLPISLCALRLGHCFLPLLLQIVQQLLGRLLSVPLRIILCPPPQILAGLLESSLCFPG